MAPFAHRVNRITIQGVFGGGVEEWSTGFYMGYADGDADLPNQQLVDDVGAAWTTFVGALGSRMSGAWRTTEVKASSFGTDGKASAEDTIYHTLNPAIDGAGGLTFPPQISLVASMYGSKARGVAAKGRMYLPGIVAPVGGNGTINDSDRLTITTAFKTFLATVNATTATDNVVVLASHGSLNADGTPKIGGATAQTMPVLGVRVGNVYDTQRRRRNGLTETYDSQLLNS